jgi:D-arabinose 1-dehydrogenase-like Zn-dependent alcohol dehydrogenase
MQAITVRDRDAGIGGLSLTDMPYPRAAENDVIVRVHAAGFTPGELDWPATWSDRAGRDRTPSVPGHELSGVVAELGYGTTGLTIGQRVFVPTALLPTSPKSGSSAGLSSAASPTNTSGPHKSPAQRH